MQLMYTYDFCQNNYGEQEQIEFEYFDYLDLFNPNAKKVDYIAFNTGYTHRLLLDSSKILKLSPMPAVVVTDRFSVYPKLPPYIADGKQHVYSTINQIKECHSGTIVFDDKPCASDLFVYFSKLNDAKYCGYFTELVLVCAKWYIVNEKRVMYVQIDSNSKRLTRTP